jgi:prevent-host-death family protein
MARSSSVVGSRELKTRLGQYLKRVRRGETILVTDRDEPVAELRPLTSSADPAVAALRRLAASGVVAMPARRRVTRFAAIQTRGGSASGAISDDRDDRG